MGRVLALLRRAEPEAADVQDRQPQRCRWHRYRWVGDDPFSGSGLYACRCGVVRPGV
jgi:hypothetical protein